MRLQQPINPEIVTGELCHQDLLSTEPLNRTRPPGRYQYSDRWHCRCDRIHQTQCQKEEAHSSIVRITGLDLQEVSGTAEGSSVIVWKIQYQSKRDILPKKKVRKRTLTLGSDWNKCHPSKREASSMERRTTPKQHYSQLWDEPSLLIEACAVLYWATSTRICKPATEDLAIK